jgi:alkylation response protein AidB-like acyl-CoA dehydrogenase
MGPWSEVLAGRPYELDDFESSFLLSRAETIYTGSTEIQKNIIGERVLGLPKDPAVDKDVAFKDLLVGTQK